MAWHMNWPVCVYTQVGGLVTDGSIRDTDTLIGYGLNTFSFSTTAKQGPAFMQPWECNGVISCGGVVVRPGDAVVGDQDGVVVVPAAAAQQVYDIAHSREVIEEIVKKQVCSVSQVEIKRALLA
jgi:regulator of RNase E activity RraA